MAIGLLSLTIWLVLVFARHWFWLARERDTRDLPPVPKQWPKVVAVVPARDEAEVIAESICSLIAQDYPGDFRIVLVDDSSSDGTGRIARRLDAERLDVVAGLPLPAGWTGKLWAVRQGVEYAGATTVYLWLTDADIAHAPDTLRTLVARAESAQLALVSLMAKLRCETLAERMLIPAFVFFFQMLYPFGLVNRSGGPGAAAGGCMLVRRVSLEAAGGIAAIRGALIDDCALGAKLKTQGPVWLGFSRHVRSVRPSEQIAQVGRMISRSAFAQLHYSVMILIGVMAAMALVFLLPVVLTLFGEGLNRVFAGGCWLLMALAFQPTLRYYEQSPLWGLALPAIASAYMVFTINSAYQHFRGRGGLWKGRVQANVSRSR